MVNEHSCGFCGREFAQDEAQPTCLACPLSGGCRLVRCPHCGYENPVAPAWVDRVRAWFGTREARQAGYDEAGNYMDEREGATCR